MVHAPQAVQDIDCSSYALKGVPYLVLRHWRRASSSHQLAQVLSTTFHHQGVWTAWNTIISVFKDHLCGVHISGDGCNKAMCRHKLLQHRCRGIPHKPVPVELDGHIVVCDLVHGHDDLPCRALCDVLLLADQENAAECVHLVQGILQVCHHLLIAGILQGSAAQFVLGSDGHISFQEHLHDCRIACVGSPHEQSPPFPVPFTRAAAQLCATFKQDLCHARMRAFD
mmetsp:Transcript_27162/g.69956  ORF Transcript_27162/g.69956 Transcript_27162/m.69956 type:complete len:226 (-) Transcript_27162:952-1629(-)